MSLEGVEQFKSETSQNANNKTSDFAESVQSNPENKCDTVFKKLGCTSDIDTGQFEGQTLQLPANEVDPIKDCEKKEMKDDTGKCQTNIPIPEMGNDNESTRLNWVLVNNSSNSSSVDGQLKRRTARDASTMTDWDDKSGDFAHYKYNFHHEDSWKPLEKISSLNCTDSCSKIHLQRQGTAMAEYLSRLQPSPLPPDIQEFLAKHNIKTDYASNNMTRFKSGNDAQKMLDISGLDGAMYCCPKCNLAYPDRRHFQTHFSGQSDERRFECNVCGAWLKRKEHLDQHKRGHSEERPFVCKVCSKGFKRNEHLRRHFITHSGSKIHACTECGKAFSRKDHLNKHSQTHIMKRVKTNTADIT